MASKPGRKPADLIEYDGTTGDPTVIAYDPGAVTGWALMSVHPDALLYPDFKILANVTAFAFGQFVGNEFVQVDEMVRLAALYPGAALVVEDFVLRQFNMGREVLSPVRLTAGFRYAISRGISAEKSEEDGPFKYEQEQWRIGRIVRVQQPALAMTTMTDDRLRRLGYYERTAGQAHKRLKENDKLRKEVFPLLDYVQSDAA
jgi:hypothetical protein